MKLMFLRRDTVCDVSTKRSVLWAIKIPLQRYQWLDHYSLTHLLSVHNVLSPI